MGWMGENEEWWSMERVSSRPIAVQWQHHSTQALAAGHLQPTSHCKIGPIMQWQVRQTLPVPTRNGADLAWTSPRGRWLAGAKQVET
jgi:hypothetical protein